MLRRSAIGNLRYALAAAGVARAERKARAEELLASGRSCRAGAIVRRGGCRAASSSGSRSRARSRKDPEILFLDEPTASLDPAATKAIEDIIRGVAARGIKVVMATHDLGEARRLAGEIVLLHRGRMIEIADAADLLHNPRTQRRHARFVAGELLV